MTKFEVVINEKYTDNPADFYIRIAEGPFENKEFTLGRVSHQGVEADGTVLIGFDYDLITPLAEGEDKDRLEEVVASIVHQIMEDMVNAEEHVHQEEITESPIL